MSECEDVSSAWLHSSDIADKQSLLKLNGTALKSNGNVWNDSGINFLCQERDISSAASEVEQKLAEQKSDKKFFRDVETSDLITFSDTADTGYLFSLGTDNMMRRTDDNIRRPVCSSDNVSDHSCSFGDVVGVEHQGDLHSANLKKSSSASDRCLSDNLPYLNEESLTPSSSQDASSTAEIRKPALPEYFTARKGSDIRNNIPDMRNVKSCDRNLDTLLHCLQPKSNLMKMKKSSPGLAKRLVNSAGQERTKAVVTDAGESAVELGLVLEESLENELDAGTGTSPITERISGNVQDSVTQRSSSELCLKDFETEHSESIALCSSQEVEQAFAESEDRGHSENGDGGGWSESVTCNVFNYSYGLRDTVVGSFAEFSDEWSHVLTMSPGLSECSEVGSSVSDDIDLSSCGEMPFVDDGLSVCDDSSLPAGKHGTSTSASEVLQGDSLNRGEDPDIVANLNLSESDVAEFFSSSFTGDFVAAGDVDEEAVCQKRRETFDLAMRDIRHAIQNSSRNVCHVDRSITDYQSAELNEEPVWIIRSKDVIQTKLQPEDKNSRFDEKAEKIGDWPLNGDNSTDDEDEETDELLLKQHDDNRNANLSNHTESSSPNAEKNRIPLKKDGDAVLIEGLLFRTSYLGSTKLISDCNPTKIKRMKQAKEAVDCVKSPVGESQPRVEVDLFVSAEKIMVLDIVRQEVMMDYALQTISYIADMDDILILMVRQSLVVSSSVDGASLASPGGQKRQVKICCHVFESDEAQLIAESISRAFQVAYGEFLRANGIDNPGLLSDINYQEVLNQQQIFGEELSRFSNKDMQQEVTISKLKGEPLGVVIVESGWGSLLPTTVVANLSLSGPAAKSNQINIGDQIMAVNGVSLIGLPLSTCQNYIRAVRPDTIVQLTLVSCSPVVEVVIKRPDIKYQLGFSVQNGVICSLLRGGIGERGGVRVGHRIIEVNGQSMVAVSHDKIIRALATCVGELHMKTMQMTIFRLLTGEHTPHFI